MIVWMRRQSIEHAKTRAQIQASLSASGKQESAVQAFEDYTKSIFPFEEQHKESEHAQHMEILKEWTSKGPVSVTALEDLTPNRTKRRMKDSRDMVREKEQLVQAGRLVRLGESQPKTPRPRGTTAGGNLAVPVPRSARRRTRFPS